MTEAHSGPLAACAWPTPSQTRPNVRYAPDLAVSGGSRACASARSSSIDPLLEDIDSATRS